MKTIIIKCKNYAELLQARASLGDSRVNYTVGMDSEETNYEVNSYVVFSTNFIKWIFVRRRLEKEMERGAQFEIIETY